MSTSRVYHAQLYTQTTRQAQRYVNRILNEIQREAKAIALVGPYTTGRLARSIDKTGPVTEGFVVRGKVGTRLSYASAVEKGAQIHDIFPKRAAHVYRFGRVRPPMLKFRWRGRLVYANQVPMGPGTIGVSHPGQKGKGFLIRPLRNAAIRHRMTIIVYEL